MKLSKLISTKIYDFRSTLKSYKIRPSITFDFYIFLINSIWHNSFIVKIHFPQRATKEDLMYNGTFHEATGTIFATVQLFGIMPVLNVKSKSVHDLKFTRMCFRYFLSIFYSLGILFMTMLTIFWISKKRLEFGKMISLVFNASNYLSIVGFMALAPRWPNVMSKWNQVDHYLPPLPHQMAKQKLAYQIKMIAFVVLFMSMSKFALNI